ncbi:kynurenine aminotransferase [Penicillium lividum]|nr:kynurenine aminotransferase [Penicillium lividum]
MIAGHASLFIFARSTSRLSCPTIRPGLPGFARTMSATAPRPDPFRPAKRVAGQRQDVWSIVNEAAAASPVQPIVNMGQGFFGYNPPKFAIDAAKDALDRVECNQYSPTKGRPRLKKAIADAYSPFFGRTLNPDTEVAITTGANEGMLSAFMGFIEPGDEVIVFEPFFDQYISNIEMPGGTIRYVPLHPPKDGATRTSSASEWAIDFEELENTINSKTRMIVSAPQRIKGNAYANYLYSHNPVGKVFSRKELQRIGDLCVKYNLIILSDEVYDRLFYVPFTRIATLSPELYERTITVGSAGKAFYATGWRVGYLIGPEHLIKYVAGAHTRICYSSVSPLQEAVAAAFEQADKVGFWDESRNEMKQKMDRFCEIFDELGIPYSEPEGGYFVLANMSSVKLPADYPFPPHVANRPRDFKLCWFLIHEVGVAAIPPTEFYTDANTHIAEDYLRFAVCKNDDVLESAKERLRGLKKYI